MECHVIGLTSRTGTSQVLRIEPTDFIKLEAFLCRNVPPLEGITGDMSSIVRRSGLSKEVARAFLSRYSRFDRGLVPRGSSIVPASTSCPFRKRA